MHTTPLRDNPLLAQYTDLPIFTRITPEHVKPAIEFAIETYKVKLEELLDSTDIYTWDNLIAPIEQLDENYSQTVSPVSHLCAVANTDELQQAHDDCIEQLSDFGAWVGQHHKLYNAIKYLFNDMSMLNDVQQYIITKWMDQYKLSGIDLELDDQVEFNKITQTLSKTVSTFVQNGLKATNGWSKLITDESQLSGIPDYALSVAQESALANQHDEGWLFTLHAPSVSAILTYADDRSLREEVYKVATATASDIGPDAGTWDNTQLVNDIVRLKTTKANLLGFETYADLSVETKMVSSVPQVFEFLNTLVDKCRTKALTEYDELVAFAQSHGVDTFEPWDAGYYIEQLQETLYSYNENELREYFPVKNVIKMMFHVVHELYGIAISRVDTTSTGPVGHIAVDVWHDQVEFYNVHNEDGDVIAGFYVDLFARPEKRGGAWMDECTSRRKYPNGSINIPVAYLNCNFTPPTSDTPSLLSMRDIETLFHEFGHCLHHMMTTVDYADAAGISGVPWDAVELPSQFMENFCWEADIIKGMSGHYKTSKQIPDSLLKKVKRAKNFRSASHLLRQLELSLLDMKIYSVSNPEEVDDKYVATISKQNNEDIAVTPAKSYNRFYTTFNHIFGGGYSAGYFSYKWAEVLSSDVYAAFEEHDNVLSRQVGMKFLDTILSQGGSDEFMTLFQNFRGREPSIDALLRHTGIE